jgi:hypothetical protein
MPVNLRRRAAHRCFRERLLAASGDMLPPMRTASPPASSAQALPDSWLESLTPRRACQESAGRRERARPPPGVCDPRRPPDAVAEVEQERGDEDADDQRVEEDAERDDDPDLGELDERQHAEDEKRSCVHDPGARDHPPRDGQAAQRRLARAVVVGVLADAGGTPGAGHGPRRSARRW